MLKPEDETSKKPRKKIPSAGAPKKKPVTTVAAKAPAVSEAPGGTRAVEIPGPTHSEISRRAYELYLAGGRRDGRAAEDWLLAERELRAERQLGAPPARLGGTTRGNA